MTQGQSRRGGWALLTAALLCTPSWAGAQQVQRVTVTGTVEQAENRQPLVGAQVVLRGTTQGALTGPEGRYTFQVSVPAGGYTLDVSYLGRRTANVPVTIPASGAVTVPAVALAQSAVELSEVVVTAPGAAAERRTLGNAVASVSGAQVNNTPAAISVGTALEGKVTGAEISQVTGQPGGGVTIRLRGTNSINGTAEPLVVVDGVIVDNNTEAMTSLSANAGRGGAAISGRLTDIAPEDIDRIDVLKGASAAALYGSRAKNGVIIITTRRGRQGTPQVTASTDFSVGSTPKKYSLNMAPIAGWTDQVYFGFPLGTPVTRYDIQDQIFRTAYGNNTNVTVSGGSGGTTYDLSGTYQSEQGILRSTDYAKKGFRARLGQQLSNSLNVSAMGNFIQTNAHYMPEGEQTQGVLTSVIFTPTSYNPAFNATTGRFPYNPLLGPNPLEILADWQAPQNVVRFIGNVEANYQLTSKLRLRYLVGLDDYREEDKYFQPPFSQSATYGGSIENPIRTSRQSNQDFTAVYEGQPTQAIGLNSTLGLRLTSSRVEVLGASATNLPPGLDILTGATQAASQSIVDFRTRGGFLQEQASFGDRLFLTAGANLEASSAFGPNERWQLFPRVNGSWLVSQEPFWQSGPLAGTLSTFRLRAAFGQTGGQPPGAYSRFNNFVNVAYAGLPGFVASTIAGNANLKPERQDEIEAGFDAGFLHDRANLEFTYYHQKTHDLVLNAPLPVSSGFSSQPQNIGEVVNRGVELTLRTVNIARQHFGWNTQLSLAANRNKVTKLVTSSDTLLVGYLNAVIIGQPLGVFYGGVYARDAQGRLLTDTITVNVPGKGNTVLRYPYLLRYNPTTKQFGSRGSVIANHVIGDPNPKWTASMNNTFTVGPNVTLNLLLDGRFGNKVANFSRRIEELFGASSRVAKEVNGDTTFRAFELNPLGRSLNYQEYIEDGSFVKLREVALAFHIGKEWARYLGAGSGELRLAGRNLYTWTHYSGLDPEVNLFGANTVAQGVDFANTPIPRQLVVGVTLRY